MSFTENDDSWGNEWVQNNIIRSCEKVKAIAIDNNLNTVFGVCIDIIWKTGTIVFPIVELLVLKLKYNFSKRQILNYENH